MQLKESLSLWMTKNGFALNFNKMPEQYIELKKNSCCANENVIEAVYRQTNQRLLATAHHTLKNVSVFFLKRREIEVCSQ